MAVVMVAQKAKGEILQVYKSGHDDLWHSDWTGKRRLLAEMGFRDLTDGQMRGLLRCLGPTVRWVVEIRSGIWHGEGLPRDWETQAKYLGLPVEKVRYLYETGVAKLRALAMEQHPTAYIGDRQESPVQIVAKGRRFKVFKRDGYRCQLCGRSAADGAVLEVDHRVPKAKGGSDDMSNLWTLCFDCNRGKRDSYL